MATGGRFKHGWYLIYTMPKHEKKVHARLVNLTMNAFLPSRKMLKYWNGRKKYIDEPLFPSYVFVYLEDHHAYRKVLSVEGCLSFVRFGKELACVNEQVVDSIRVAVEHDWKLYVSARVFSEGKRVVLSAGRWAHISCELVEYNHTECVIVRVAPLPHNLLLEIPQNNLLEI